MEGYLEPPPQHQVFINFRGVELRNGFVSHLVKALERNQINVFIDIHEDRGQPIEILLERIQESRIAVAIFSGKYTESIWCVEELAMIKDCMDKGILEVIPIFYKVDPSTVKYLKGEFGDAFRLIAKDDERKKKWKEAFKAISELRGIVLDEKSDESIVIKKTVKDVWKMLNNIPSEGSQIASVGTTENSDSPTSSSPQKDTTFGINQRLKELEDKLDLTDKKTRIIGVVGMPGIGKTTLLDELFKKWQNKFRRCALIDQIREKLKSSDDFHILPKLLVQKLLRLNESDLENVDHPYEKYKGILLERKVFVILDDVSNSEQIKALLGRLDWISEGSRIVIATNDMSLLKHPVQGDPYVVQRLNQQDGLKLFSYHAFDQENPPEEFMKLSEEFVHYAKGYPLALKILGQKLRGKKNDIWVLQLMDLAQSLNASIGIVFQVIYDELTLKQKEAFHDIACFRLQDLDYIENLLDSSEAVKVLANKFLINICDGRVEMHDLLYTFSRDLDPKASTQGGSKERRLWRHQDIIKKDETNVLQNKMRASNVRGIFLDLSEVEGETILDKDHFNRMTNLRYLRFYNSHCPQECKTDNKINLPDGLELPLEEVRCLHWLKFPLEELPNGFNPINLVDLKLPYSEIKQLWEGDKETPVLRWVDLSHSSKLIDLLALSKAENLQRLNLEGCTSLDELPVEIQNMKSLVFMNLRGCIRLCYLPKMNLISLKTLILSDCSNLKEFQLISESVEFLHLDGTSIEGLPPAIKNLQRLVVLNLKNCKMLECLPNCMGELKFLDELILSGCSRLKNLPDVRHSLKHLQILPLEGTGANEMPSISCFTKSEGSASGLYSTVRGYACGVNGVSSLRRLILNGNDFVTLQPDIGKLYNLTWLDVKQCTKLISVPKLPPRLQYFDAHGCDSLETVANPLALPVLCEQNRATFIFSNCNKLDQDSKDSIMSYTRWRSQLMLNELTRYDEDPILEAFTGTCFPGWEVPAWFSHRVFGPVLKPKLPLHLIDNRFTGIALCAVVSFHGYHEQRNRLLVKCNCVFSNEDGSHVSFSCTFGSSRESSNIPGKIELCHVFIGYTIMLYIKKLGKEDEEGCSHTEASFEFEVTDGTEVLEGCEVLKCGFSFVYATDELRVKSGVRGALSEANHYGAYSKNAISDVTRETEAAERSQDSGIDTTSQPPIARSLVSPAEYGTGSDKIRRETHIRALDVDARLSGEPQHHSNNLIPMVASSSQVGIRKSHSQVFVSYHGAELGKTFVKQLVSTLSDAGVNVFTDNDKGNGIKQLMQLYQRIEESKIALVIFSKRYVESNFCLNELVMMDELTKAGKLLVIPVFYNVRSSDVRNLKGEFGQRFKEMKERYKDELEKVLKWETSVKSIAKTIGIHSEVYGKYAPLVEAIVEAVQRTLTTISEGNPKYLGSANTVTDHVFAFLWLFSFVSSCLFYSTLMHILFRVVCGWCIFWFWWLLL